MRRIVGARPAPVPDHDYRRPDGGAISSPCAIVGCAQGIERHPDWPEWSWDAQRRAWVRIGRTVAP